MNSLMQDLERIVAVLRDAQIRFEVIGGVAVNAYILETDESRSFVTKDVDLLVNRSDLDRIVAAAQAAGYTCRRIVGGFTLIRPGQSVREAVHLLFGGEKPVSSQPLPNPVLGPEDKALSQYGLSIPVANLRDLVFMKLNSCRPKDETHLEVLDRCGLITPAIEADLPEVLRDRLEQVRKRYPPDLDEFAEEM